MFNLNENNFINVNSLLVHLSDYILFLLFIKSLKERVTCLDNKLPSSICMKKGNIKRNIVSYEYLQHHKLSLLSLYSMHTWM